MTLLPACKQLSCLHMLQDAEVPIITGNCPNNSDNVVVLLLGPFAIDLWRPNVGKYVGQPRLPWAVCCHRNGFGGLSHRARDLQFSFRSSLSFSRGQAWTSLLP